SLASDRSTRKAATNGVAGFSDLHVRYVGSGYPPTAPYTLSLHDALPIFTVGPAALYSFSWSSIGDPQTAGAQFHPTATAYDAFGNGKTHDNTPATLTTRLTASPTDCTGPCTASVVFHNATHFSSGVAALD